MITTEIERSPAPILHGRGSVEVTPRTTTSGSAGRPRWASGRITRRSVQRCWRRMSKSSEPEPIRRLLEELTALLYTHTFQPMSSRSQWTGKVHILRWVRDSGWKRDVFQLAWRGGSWPYCSLGVDWSIARGDDHVLVSAINPSYWRRQSSDTRVPEDAEAQRYWGLVLLADAQAALEWFDSCSTKSGALAEVRRHDRNGPGVGTDVYRYIEEYLVQNAPEVRS